MKKLLVGLMAAILLMPVFAGSVSADTRCGGRAGVQVWQDANKSGPSMTFCTSSSSLQIADSDLSNNTTNLSWGANWNDRITSIETFNFNNKRLTLWPDANFQDNGFGSDRTVVMSQDSYVSCLCNYWTTTYPGGFNDRTSSMKSAPII